jgi:hypothetical protein
MPRKKAIIVGKKKYRAPMLESYGNISNFTTGGSGKKSEYTLTTGMGGSEDCKQTSMNMNRNTQMC